MPRCYFHLSAPDESFRDLIGFEVSDLSAAHLRARQLADRVRMIGGWRYAPRACGGGACKLRMNVNGRS